MAIGKAATWERRGVSKAAAILRGAAVAAVVGHAAEATATARMNVGKRGGQFNVSDALVAGPAVAKDIGRMPCLGLEGYLEKVSLGLITLSAPQPCGRTSALKTGEAGGVLRVGEFDVLVGERDGKAAVSERRRRRRGRRAGPGMPVGHRGGMAVITAGPGRRPGHGRRHRRDVPLHWQQERRQDGEVGAGGRAEGQPQACRVQRHPHQQDNGRGPDGRPDRRRRGVRPRGRGPEGIRRASGRGR